MAVISKVLTGDPRHDRFQDQVIQAVNPLTKAIQKISAQPVVTGSKGGNAALASLIAALVQLGLIKDQTT